MFGIFIDRPVLSIVISIIIVMLGALFMGQLPVTQYPEIEPPSVTVTTKYTGANAEACAKAVVTPLERSINGVAGMMYMTSVSGNDGTSIIQVYFETGIDPDLAAVNVQNRVNAVLDELPEEVVQAGVITEKEVNSMLMYLNLKSDDPDIDEKFIYNFADINVLAELKRIEGVGFADILGSREYSMRLWLRPDRMTTYGITASEIADVLRMVNIEAAPGKIGESSGRTAQSLQYVLRYTGKFNTEEEYENIVIKSGPDGEVLRLKDVAEVEFGSLEYDVVSKENGKPSAAIMIKQRPGSNASEVIRSIKSKMEELKRKVFPPGIDYTISYDVSRFLDASIKEVNRTILEAFLLVTLVVFVFLQDFRSTLIPAIAVPVSLIGTFFFMNFFGFSINLLTLFALVLSIGIVVDNAIVVVEAVHVKMHDNNWGAFRATKNAMKEISGAIIAITLVMSAVFIPVAFMEGPVGIFYRQFAITMAIAIAISGLTALTLAPALCASMLRPAVKRKGFIDRFFTAFNRNYQKMEDAFAEITRKLVARKFTVAAISLLILPALFLLARWLPTGFIPDEDQGMFYVNITTPSGSTLERTQNVVDQVDQIAREFPEVEAVSTLAGFSLFTDGVGASFGMAMVSLKPWKERKRDVKEIMAAMDQSIAEIRGANIQLIPPPAVPGYGNASGFEIRLLDKTNTASLQEIQSVAEKFVKQLNDSEEIEDAFASYDASFPQYMLSIDYDKAAQKGIEVKPALENLQALIGSYYATNFIRFGQLYRVMLQALPRFRANPEDVLKLHIKNKQGEMVPYSSFMTISKVYGPEQLTRYNMYNSAMINGGSAKGFSSGDAVETIRNISADSLPRGYDVEWSGMTRDEVESGSQTFYIFIICMLFVYLLLCAQYESFLLPLAVIFSLPPGIFGAYFFLFCFGLQSNIFAQVAMIMLIGLLGKNAILIVEFATLSHRRGESVMNAAVNGAKARLRPILMTSFAFVSGLLPLLFSSGAGSAGNRTIGSAAAGGMLFGTVLGVFLVPVLYLIFAELSDKLKKKRHKEPIALSEKI